MNRPQWGLLPTMTANAAYPPTSSLPPSPPPCAPDRLALDRQLRRLSGLTQAPWLHQEVARRLADKLAPIRLRPAAWLDWSACLGAGAEPVQAQYPHARRWVWEPTEALAERSRQQFAASHKPQWRQLWRAPAAPVFTEQDAELPWRPTGVDMLWANMTLHACPDLPAVMAHWHEQLAFGGFLMCSGLGPDTARELRQVYRANGWARPTIDFIDMHDLGDALVKAGFADPVMDMETITLTWATPQALMHELRTWGGNVALGRHAGLRTPRWRDRLCAQLSEHLMRPDGRLGLTVELVYGHAVKPEPRIQVEPEARVSLADMKRMVRRP